MSRGWGKHSKPYLNPAHEDLRKPSRRMHAAMRKTAAFLFGLMAIAASPLAAQTVVYEEVTEEIVEVPATGSERFVQSHPDAAPGTPRGIASYGPFRVIDNDRAGLRRWVADPQKVKPSCLMPAFGLGQREVELVVVGPHG